MDSTEITTSWSAHLAPGSPLTGLDAAQLRARLRYGNLGTELLPGGSGPAVIVGDTTLTHDQLCDRASAIAGGLRDLGLGAGDRIALFAQNSPEWILAYLAIQRLGAVVVPFNPAYKSAEARHILTDAEPRAVFTDAERARLVRPLLGELPWIRHLLEVEHPPWGRRLPPPDLLDTDPAVILYTSGTTGRPKGALLDQGNLLAQARGVIEAWRWSRDDVLVLALPLFHLHGLGMGLNGTLLSGSCLHLLAFSPEQVVAALEKQGSMFFGVPAMYQRLTVHLESSPSALDRVRLFVSGSAPLPPALFERCQRLLGQPPVERYGITEGGIVVSNPYDGPRRAGRVGHPLPGVELRLSDRGEVLLRGGQVFSGYWRNPEATASALVDGWLHTGDGGELDQDGSLAIRGRFKELIITGGFNVYPREVEIVLEDHPAVAEVAVAGLPSERWGEEVTAFVVLAAEASEQELIEHCRERLANYKVPRSIRFIPALPRNAIGKVQRSELR